MVESSKGERKIERYTHDEWLAEGARLFGADFGDWQFVCPVCTNIAKVSDYKQYKEKGATPDSATCECIGRYDGSKGTAFGEVRGKPCNYALYGLFRFVDTVITFPDGKIRNSFKFARQETNGT